MNDRIELEVTYPHPPEAVWKALTDSKALSQWLMPSDFKALIGYRFRLDRDGQPPIKGKVTDVEEGKLLAYTWNDGEDEEGSLVVWTVEPTDGGTRLRLRHEKLEAPVVNCLAIDNYFNWRYALKHSLPGLLRLLQAQEKTPQPPIVYAEVSR
jgi:uncharacterized protein YndB with AHSA1/START domain